MSDPTKVADETEALLQNNNANQARNNNGIQQRTNPSNSNNNEAYSDNIKYIWDYLNHSKSQFFLLVTNIVFFIVFRRNIDIEDNFPQGKENCFTLRSWSTLVNGAYLAGIFIRISYLILMAIVVYYKKEMKNSNVENNKKEMKNSNVENNKKLVEDKVKWNLRYKYFYEMRDVFLGAKIVIGIFLLVGMTIAVSQNEPCGNLRNLALFWIYIYNIVFLFFPISMLLLCLYPYSFACKIFSAFLKFYSLQLDIFEEPKTNKTD
jgi:hypothetical protein